MKRERTSDSGVDLPPISPGHRLRWIEFEAFSGQLSDDGDAADLLPKSSGEAIIHEKVRTVELTRNAELRVFSLHFALVHDGAATERSVGDEQMFAFKRLVDDLMPDENLERIGAILAIDLNADHQTVRVIHHLIPSIRPDV